MYSISKRSWQAFIIAILTSASIQAAAPLWKANFDSGIKWQKLAETGHLIVCTDKALVALDPVNGSEVWRNDELGDLKDEQFDIVGGTQFALISKSKGVFGTKTRLIFMDLSSGKELWNTDSLGITSSSGHFTLLQVGGILIYGALGSNANDRQMILIDLPTGALRWTNKELFKKKFKPELIPVSKTKVSVDGNQNPMFDSPETMILYISGDGIVKVNSTTGAQIWAVEVKSKRAPALSYGFASMFLSDDQSILYTPTDKTVYAIKTSDGSHVWAKPPQLKGIVNQMEMTSAGMLIRTGADSEGKGNESITLIDVSTGVPKWKKEFDKLKQSTNYQLVGDKIYVCSDEKLYAINLADGVFEQVAKDVKMDGGEIASSMTAMSGDLLFSSSQNLLLVDVAGKQKWHSFHKAPGSSLFAKIASTAVLTAINAGSAMQGYSNAMANAQRSASGQGSASYSLITSNPYMSKRYKATRVGANYQTILTNINDGEEKGPGLVKVSKTTGQAEKKIVLGTKDAEYQVDEYDSRLYFLAGDKEIQCFEF